LKASDLMAASGWKSESIAQFPSAPMGCSRWGSARVRIFSHEPLAAEPVDQKDIPIYWGYEIEAAQSLEAALDSRKDALVILTSRKGKAATPEVLQNLGPLGRKRNLAVVFGSPARGVDAFLSAKAIGRYEMINTIPHQGTETVRVDEAVFSTLALLNLVPMED